MLRDKAKLHSAELGTRDNCCANLAPATIVAPIWHLRQLLRQSGTRDNCCDNLAPQLLQQSAPATIAATFWHLRPLLLQSGTRDNCCDSLALFYMATKLSRCRNSEMYLKLFYFKLKTLAGLKTLNVCLKHKKFSKTINQFFLQALSYKV